MTNPVGKLNGSFAELHKAGCIQTGADVCSDVNEALGRFGMLFDAVNIETNRNPCNGCPAFDGGKCKAYQQHHSSCAKPIQRSEQKTPTKYDGMSPACHPPGTAKYPGMSVADIAKKLGCSKNKVRRQKVAAWLHGQ